VDKSLLQAEQPGTAVRYRLLETIREYAAAKQAAIGDGENTALHRQHRDYFLALAEEAAPHLRGLGEVEWANRLEDEIDNLRLALLESLDDGDGEPGLRLVHALGEFWMLRGRGSEGVAALRAQLDRPTAQAPTTLRGRALAAAARLTDYIVADDHAAASMAEEAMTIAQATADDALAANAMLTLAWARYRQGDHAACQVLVDEALPIARSLDDPRAVAHLLNLQGSRQSAVGEDARASLEEAAGLYRQAGDRWGAAVVLTNMGGAALAAGDLERARTTLSEAANLSRELNHFNNLAICSVMEGTVAYLEGDNDDADRLFHESLKTGRRLGFRRLVAYALLGLALVASRAGDAERAATLHGVFDARESSLDDLEQGLRDVDVEHLRTVLGDDRFEAAYQAGRNLPFDDALALADQALQSAAL
jgi:tetratricopeptide (TPR) repeat protein